MRAFLSGNVVICLCAVSACVLADESPLTSTTTKTTKKTSTPTVSATTENVETGLFGCLSMSLCCSANLEDGEHF